MFYRTTRCEALVVILSLSTIAYAAPTDPDTVASLERRRRDVLTSVTQLTESTAFSQGDASFAAAAAAVPPPPPANAPTAAAQASPAYGPEPVAHADTNRGHASGKDLLSKFMTQAMQLTSSTSIAPLTLSDDSAPGSSSHATPNSKPGPPSLQQGLSASQQGQFPGLDLANGHMDYIEALQGHTAYVHAAPVKGSDDFHVTSDVASLADSTLQILGNVLGASASPSDQGAPAQTVRNITVDMKVVKAVTGLQYLPTSIQETKGEHAVRLSLDGKHWTEVVAKGAWSDELTLKTISFERQVARYVRLSLPAQGVTPKSKRDSVANQVSQPTYGTQFTVLSAPKPNLPRDGWTVSADSFQGGDTYFTVDEAIDGASTTWWQTPSTGGPNFPHSFTIDTGKPTSVSGFTYLPPPPQDITRKISNGTIGQWTFEQSSDGQSWVQVANGTWQDNTDVKVVEFDYAFPITERYWRLNALSEAGNRVPFAGAAEINLLDGSAWVNFNFNLLVDSEQAVHTAAMAFDNDATSYWMTEQTGPNVPGFPHHFTIDMAIDRNIYGLIYVPRQDGPLDGNIGQHIVEISKDGTTWNKVAEGTFDDTKDPKDMEWTNQAGRFLRITALSEAGNRGPWTSASQFSPLFVAGDVPSIAGQGSWSPIIDFPLVPVAVVPLYTGKVLAWSSYRPDNYLFSPSGTTYTATYDPATGTVSERIVKETNHDMFCPGLATDFSGRAIVTGGNTANRTSLYDPNGDKWISGPNMEIPRGYQSATMMSDGRYFTIGGSWSGEMLRQKYGEVYDPVQNTWTAMPGCTTKPMLTNDVQGIYRSDNHAWLFAWSNATVFQAGPSNAMNWYYPGTTPGDVKPAGTRLDDLDSMNGNAVLFDAVAGKIFTAGGSPSYQDSPAHASAHIITIGAPGTPATVEALPSMHYKRALANSVVLPDGKILIVGGQSYAIIFTDDEAILRPEIFDPVTKTFTVLAQMRVPRNYHSTAVLLADGTVFSGGGGLCGTCSANHFDAQIYSPPYLFNGDGTPAARPQITSLDKNTTAVGGTLNVKASEPIAQWSLLRVGSATHSIDTDQRRVPLGNPADGVLKLPTDPGVLLPGHWWLFAIGTSGVPSVASQILVTPS